MKYTELENELKKIAHLSNIGMLAHWDAATGLPTGSANSRNQEMASFSAVLHEMATSAKIGFLIEESLSELDKLNEWQRANLYLVKKNYDSSVCISPELQHEYSIASSESELVWRTARAENDFSLLQPYLERVFKAVREIAKIKSETLEKPALDVLIDIYDPDRTAAEVENVFNILKAGLPDLISEIVEKQKTEKLLPITKLVDKQTQKSIALKVMEVMEFDMNKGRLDESVHPFCTGSNDDVRLTTRYDVNNFLSGIFGVIHEAGHGLYQQNLPTQYRDQPVGTAKGMAFHESQSLIMEMQAGTSRPFMEFFAKLLRDEFSFRGSEFSADNLYKLVNRVKPSLIRVEADEVTYPLHVILRFEIEKEIINNNLKVKDLPAVWNQKMQNYLGITPDSDSNGCMQDIHWPSGSIGYFPSYTNGAIIASMLMKQAKSTYPAIDDELAKGSFSSLNKFLNDNLRNYGSLKNTKELLQKSTGYESVQAEIFFNYIKEKLNH